MLLLKLLIGLLSFVALSQAHARIDQKVVDIPTRPGVTQRAIVLAPPDPKAAIVLIPGGHGGLQLFSNGSMKWGENNFLVRTRQLFAEQGLLVAVVDAPSDRQDPPFLQRYRQTPEHVSDLKAVIAWLRESAKVPVWLVGTSRGTQSAAHVAAELHGADGPDGIVLTATILVDERSRAVTAMSLDRIRVPTLLVHHEQDGCAHCPFTAAQQVIDKLTHAPRKQLIAVTGGHTVGHPCEARAYHGFNGVEVATVRQIGDWISTRQ